MAISTEDALKMVEESMAGAGSQPSETKETDTTSAQTSVADENKDNEVETTESKKPEGETGGDDKEVGVSRPKSDEDKGKRTYQARVDRAFIKLKEEAKSLRNSNAEKDKRIKELENKLKLGQSLEESDFKNKVDYHKHIAETVMEEKELSDLKKERDLAKEIADDNDFVADIHENASKFFKDEEADTFERLMENGFNAFIKCVNEHNAGNAVAEFLADSPMKSIVLRTLMTNPTALKSVLDRKSDAGRIRELQVIENNLSIRQNLAKHKNNAEEKKLPLLGSMKKTENKSEPERFDDNWALNYLKQHRSGRF